jgi:hypothetical protein
MVQVADGEVKAGTGGPCTLTSAPDEPSNTTGNSYNYPHMLTLLGLQFSRTQIHIFSPPIFS